jgi:hypothetical protein
MYKEIGRGTYSPMQTVAGRSSNNVRSQTRSIAFFAVLLFALSGLISGFAVGAFIHPKTGPTANSSSANTLQTTQKTRTPVSTTTHLTKLGYPIVDQVVYVENADGNSPYTFSAQAVDQSIDPGHGYPVHASGITCKLWLQNIPHGNGGKVVLPSENLAKMNIQGPLTDDEISDALNFDNATPQIQLSNASGKASWKFTVATSVHPGTYYLVVLMDWYGKHYNWSWVIITIKQAN